MKKPILAVMGLTALLAGTALAVVLVPFHGWDALIAKSPEIGVVEVTRDGVLPSEIEVVAVLKG